MDKWETRGRTLIHENPYLNLSAYDVVRPNGVRAPFYVVKRPNFAIIIPLTPKFETYLVGQYRYSMSYYSWEFPMGAVKGKSIPEMAKIELHEETGLEAKRYIILGSFNIAHGFLRQEAHVYIARDLTESIGIPKPDEFLQVRKISLREAKMMIEKGDIRDAPTICAYHLLEIYCKKTYRKNI